MYLPGNLLGLGFRILPMPHQAINNMIKRIHLIIPKNQTVRGSYSCYYLFKRKCFLLCLYTHAAKIINILKNRQLYKGIGRTDDKTHQIYSASFFFFLNPESKITSQIAELTPNPRSGSA